MQAVSLFHFIAHQLQATPNFQKKLISVSEVSKDVLTDKVTDKGDY